MALVLAMKPATAVKIVANELRPAPVPMAELDDEVDPEAPVAWAEPGAPEERVTATPEPEATGGFVLLLLVSMYASDIGLLRHVTTGSILK